MSSADTDSNGPGVLKRIFIRVGVLPFFLGIALVVFTLLSDKFLTLQNLVNVGRQSVYLILVSLGQMLVLISGVRNNLRSMITGRYRMGSDTAPAKDNRHA